MVADFWVTDTLTDKLLIVPRPPEPSTTVEETPGPVPRTFTMPEPTRAMDSRVKPYRLEMRNLTALVIVILHFPSKHARTFGGFAAAAGAAADAGAAKMGTAVMAAKASARQVVAVRCMLSLSLISTYGSDGSTA